MPTLAGRSAITRSLGWALAALGCAIALTACVEFALFAQASHAPAWLSGEFTAAGLVYGAAGIAAWWLRPSNGTGPIMLLGALSWLLAALANTTVPVLACAGTVTAMLPVAIVVHLLLAFPSGRLRSVHARALAAAGYFTALVLQIPPYLFVPQASPGGLLAVAARPDLAHAGRLTQNIVGGLGMLAVVAVLAARIRRADRARRQILLPLYAYSIVAVLIIPLGQDVLVPLTGISPVAVAALQVSVLAGVPVAFAAGVLAGRFARMSEVDELGAWLGAAEPGRPPLERALARALGDESVRLAFWVPGRSGYVDARGQPCGLPGPGDQRATAAVTLGERPIGAIIYDPMLIADAELVRAAGRVVALAVDRERLTAELLASQDELLASRDQLMLSRARLAEAADAERRRIAQDLNLIVTAKTRSGRDALSRLSARQLEVLALIAEGASNAAIARKLTITEHAVVRHCSNIYDQLGLQPSDDEHRRVLAVLRYLTRQPLRAFRPCPDRTGCPAIGPAPRRAS